MFSPLESWLPLVGGVLLFVAAVVPSPHARQVREPADEASVPGQAGYAEVIIADPQHVRPVVRLISNGEHIIRVS